MEPATAARMTCASGYADLPLHLPSRSSYELNVELRDLLGSGRPADAAAAGAEASLAAAAGWSGLI